MRTSLIARLLLCSLLIAASWSRPSHAEEWALTRHWLYSTAHDVPDELTSEQSGYFSLIQGKNDRLYVGTAKYGHNAYLVEFNPADQKMKMVLDAQKEIGTDVTGFAAQAKFHTRNNVGKSGKIYVATKQGYPKKGESRDLYQGGYPMVYDPATDSTRVYDIPVPKQGVISITPDESRGVAYISTCSDERPIESTHFMILDLETGKYRDLMDCRHLYAFIVVDHLGRAYHPILGGKIARYDPRSDKLSQLTQTINGAAPGKETFLAREQGHPINWDISPDRKTMYAVPMSENQLYAYDLSGSGNTLPGRSLGPIVPGAEKTDCRAMCVGPDGTVWAGVAATFRGRGQYLHLISYSPGAKAPVDHGPVAVGNPEVIASEGKDGKPLPWSHGFTPLAGGTLIPRYTIMSICAARDGTVYFTTLYPFTLHAVKFPKVAAVTTAYYHNSHADMLLSRLFQTDTLDFQGDVPPLDLKSVYIDQFPKNDTSRKLLPKNKIAIAKTIPAALTHGSKELAVDGVFLIAEHGEYPESKTGQIQYPKRQMFSQIVQTFDAANRYPPVFCDKHLADNWADAKWIYDTAKEKNIPMMAGSSIPGLWRYPPVDVKRGAKLKQIVGVSYHRLDTYGFHALEMVQALAERRAGGETGVVRVRTISGDAVWKAGEQKLYDRALLDEALTRLKVLRVPKGKTLEETVPEPVLFVIEYKDGLKAFIFTLNGPLAEWSACWQYASGETESTLFYTQEARPFAHFNYLLQGVEKMMFTGRPTWPVERTLMTTGLLDDLLISHANGGRPRNTPHLRFSYQSNWNWRQPPKAPADRPIPGQ